MKMQKALKEKIPVCRDRVKQMLREGGSLKISDISVRHLFSGIRGLDLLIGNVSYVDPYEGIHFRGHSVSDILQILPKPKGCKSPYAGGMYYLLMTGDIPTLQDALEVEDEWKTRAEIPTYVVNMLQAMPKNTHPMTMLSQAILALQADSKFDEGYNNGLQKLDYWQATLEDSLNLTAKTPALAAAIYNIKYRDRKLVSADPNLDWSANFGHMIGKGWDQHYQELCRLFFGLHADQGTGNVSVHTACLVNSTLSDVYYSCSAAMNGLAGPLHGRANQDCLIWLLGILKKFGSLPTKEQLKDYVWETLNRGKIIPGYGHAVLRNTDPRFTAQLKFGKAYMADSKLFKLVEMVYEVVPHVLTKHGKAKSPWPNVDAISGTLQYQSGLKEFDFYTVLFGVGRMLGITANLVWSRAIMLPLERPQSITLDMVEQKIAELKVKKAFVVSEA
ncbi:MAG TPA: citrate (Si)-synthase [Anaerolineae bacterium]|nr:citrate (Si)-synthase [Anaerolineae bacterium]